MSVITFYNALTGASTLVDSGGSGGGSSRSKAWLDEVPRWLKEAVEKDGSEAGSPIDLKGLGLGILANYPVFLDGRGRESNAIGNNAPIQTFNGVDILEVRKYTVELSLGDGSETDFGQEALTQPDKSLNDFANTGSDGSAPPAPRGGQVGAFIVSDADTHNLSATDGILTIIVNGVSFAVTVGTGAAVTAEALVASINAAGVPVDAVANDIAGDGLLLLITLAPGAAQTIQVDTTAGTAGAVIFAAAGNAVHVGKNGPLNAVETSSDGLRPQRRILPGTITVTAGGVILTDTLSSGNLGTLSSAQDASSGSINYLTGAIDIDFITAPANTVPVTATFKAMTPLVLSEQVRIPRGGKELAILLK